MNYLLLVAAFVLFTLANGQTIPTCAVSCFASAIQASGCGMTDYYCQCTSGKQEITEYVYTCLMKSSCSQNDVQTINSAVAATCSSATATASSTAAGSNIASANSVTQSATESVNSDATSPSGAPPLSLTGGGTGSSYTTTSATSTVASGTETSRTTALSTAAPPKPAPSSRNNAGTLSGIGAWLSLAGMFMAVF